MIKRTEATIEKLANYVIDEWDLDSLKEYAFASLQNEYSLNQNLFEEDWLNNFGDKTVHKDRILVQVLWESVEHWYQNWLDIDNAKVGPDHCPLCRHCIDVPHGINCTKCPIMWKTGYESCVNSPWEYANEALDIYRTYGNNKEDVRDKIEDEYRFLVKLAIEYSEYGEIEQEIVY